MTQPFGKFSSDAERAIIEGYGQDVWNIFPIIFEHFPNATTSILFSINDGYLFATTTDNIKIRLNNCAKDMLSLQYKSHLGKPYRTGPDFPVVYYFTRMGICHHETHNLKKLSKNLATLKLTEIIET